MPVQRGTPQRGDKDDPMRQRSRWLCVGVLAASAVNASAQVRPASGKELPPELRAVYTVPEGARVVRDIEYAKVGDVSLKLDLYLPREADPQAKAQGPKPLLIVYIHGGGWREGSKNGCPLMWLVSEGYAVASIGYRLSRTATFPAQIHDCKGAIRWLRAHASEHGYDAARIGASGVSAGGHLVALLATSGGVETLEGDVGGNTDQSSRVHAVVDFFGPTDLPALAAQGHPEFTTSLAALFLGDPISGRGKEEAVLASPLHHVTADDAPILIIQGDNDPLVKPAQSISLHEAYTKAGVESALEIVPNGGHGSPEFFNEPRRKLISDFFDKHLRGQADTSKR